jgi:hypothetical protein
LVSGSHLELMTRFFSSIGNLGFIDVWRPLWREDGSIIYSCNCFWALPEQALSGPSPRRTHDHILLSHLRLPQPWGPGPCIHIRQEQGGPLIPRGIGYSSYNSGATFLMLPLGGLHVKHALQRGICVRTEHLLWTKESQVKAGQAAQYHILCAWAPHFIYHRALDWILSRTRCFTLPLQPIRVRWLFMCCMVECESGCLSLATGF